MTINNTCFNPYPQSCALNSSLYSNNNKMWNGTGFKRCSQNTPVPESKPFSFEDKQYWDGVHVPNGEVVPMGCKGQIDMNPMFNKDIFKCPDGTILNLKTRKVVQNSNEEGSSREYWGNRKLDNHFSTHSSNDWNDSEINRLNPYISKDNPQGLHLDGDDLDYKRYSDMKNSELQNNMNDLQKKLLNYVENGRFNSKTRLIEESKRNAK